MNTISQRSENDNGIVLPYIKYDICFNNVSFQYENSMFMLHDLSISIEKGKKYAIIGESGSGKTTFLSLLMGHYGNYCGNIYIDGIELRKISKISLAPLFAIISQNVFLFDDSLLNNITLFQAYSESTLLNTIQIVGLSTLINR